MEQHRRQTLIEMRQLNLMELPPKPMRLVTRDLWLSKNFCCLQPEFFPGD